MTVRRSCVWVRSTALLLGCAAVGGMGQSTPPVPPPPWVMGYLVGYERELLSPERLNWKALTHLMVGRVVPRPGGTLDTTFDIDAVNGPVWAKAAVQQAHAHGVKALLMVGGAGEHTGFASAASPANRTKFVKNILAVVDSSGFDGVDLDWEPLSAADEAPLKALAQSLRQQRPGLTLTLPVAFVNANDPVQEARPSLKNLVGVFDRFNIMSYGMSGVYEGWQAWHSSALTGETENTPSSVQSSVDAYLRAGIPAAQLGLGIGFYGLCYQGVTAPRQIRAGMQIVASDGDMSYVNIIRSYLRPGTRQWDAAAQVPYLSSSIPLGRHACTFVSYEDAASIALKGQYVRRRGLGSVIIWTLGQGHLGAGSSGALQSDPLLAAVQVALRP
ncbi:glycoside hydrolase family 18 protein [Deinococcus oregonensis]|uniref:chitinase n=1 Tax=Deinococcus oregonensis TaxID=1805970 RepID=A0ABV6AU43_9DEIO